MDREQAQQDLELIARVLDQTRRRVDPQMFHSIIWGSLVLIWYPLMSWFALHGRGLAQGIVSIGSLVTGTLLSSWLGWWYGKHPRLDAANTDLSRKLGQLTGVFVATGVALSVAIPTLAHGGERFMPHLWGMIYGLMLLTYGVIYSREFFWCGLPSLVATIVALRWPEYAGFILGPAMGIGCIVAGSIAERRVARMRRENVEVGAGVNDEA